MQAKKLTFTPFSGKGRHTLQNYILCFIRYMYVQIMTSQCHPLHHFWIGVYGFTLKLADGAQGRDYNRVNLACLKPETLVIVQVLSIRASVGLKEDDSGYCKDVSHCEQQECDEYH